jgi:large repetitive protein
MAWFRSLRKSLRNRRAPRFTEPLRPRLRVLRLEAIERRFALAGIVVTPTSGLTTTESGGQATFDVVLDFLPLFPVTITLASQDPTEGTISTASLTFNLLDWAVPQTVTITGVNDDVDDGNIAYTIVTNAASSLDPFYNGLNASDVSVTNTDNDTAGILVTPTSGLVTSEASAQATFDVVLQSEPTASVTIAVASGDLTEGTPSTALLTFTTANWNVAQTVTVTGQNDDVDDSNVGYSIVLSPAASGDANYNGLNPSDVSLTNIDNDTAGILVTPTSGLVTTEAGDQATFDVVLESEPTADVMIAVATGDATEGSPSTALLMFTAANWNVAQTVTVTGANDDIDDDGATYSIVLSAATSGDANYNGLDPNDVGLTNTDNDTAGISVTPTSGLTTTEAGGQATFDVVLESEPTADVTINVATDDPTEGATATAVLTFTAANWNVAQTVTITGANDDVDDGDGIYAIVLSAATSSDANYDGIDPTDVNVTNTDDDSAGIVVTPTSGLSTTEAGGQVTFDVVLTSEPTADMTIAVASDDSGEGTASIALLTFTAGNWNIAQTITVTGANDDIDDGDQGYGIILSPATSGDANYNGINPDDVSISNADNDTAGIAVTPTGGLVTTETGGQATFDVVLESEPTADVMIVVTSDDTTEGTPSTALLTFTAANWNIAQTVTVTGVNDDIDDNDKNYAIVLVAATSSDANYHGLNPNDVSLTNVNDDMADIVVTPTNGLATSESGGQATFDVVLTSEPTADVTIAVTSDDSGEGTPSTALLTFTAANWNVAQTVTVTGTNDDIDDGDQVYGITLGAATSSDANYSGLDASDVSLTNIDDDTAGILVMPTSGLSTTESGGQATFDVALTSEPTADVTIAVSSSDSSEGTPSTALLTFTAANWNMAQTVSVTGANDDIDDGDTAYSIVLSAASSSDANYNGLDPSDVNVMNSDDDTAGILVTPTSGLSTTEAGGQATFSVVLTSEPTADVTISVASGDTTEGTPSTMLLAFTTANWNVAQTVTITGANDHVDDSDQGYGIVLGPATSGDANYHGVDPSDVSLTNLDDDAAGIIVAPTGRLTTDESGSQAAFDVVLTSEPTADVTIGVSTSDATEGLPSTALVTFNAANWNVPQTVTVTGASDDLDDADVAYFVVLAAATSSDAVYDGMDASDVSLLNVDTTTIDKLFRSFGPPPAPPSVTTPAMPVATVEFVRVTIDPPPSLQMPEAPASEFGSMATTVPNTEPNTSVATNEETRLPDTMGEETQEPAADVEAIADADVERAPATTDATANPTIGPQVTPSTPSAANVASAADSPTNVVPKAPRTFASVASILASAANRVAWNGADNVAPFASVSAAETAVIVAGTVGFAGAATWCSLASQNGFWFGATTGAVPLTYNVDPLVLLAQWDREHARRPARIMPERLSRLWKRSALR